MPGKRLLLVPPLLVACVVTYGLTVPSHRSAGQAPSSATGTASPTVAVAATSTASVTATAPAGAAGPAVVAGLPDGLSGQLTYRTGRELVTVAFPSAAAIQHGPVPPVDGAVSSADGLWSATTDCPTTCHVLLKRSDGTERVLDIPYVAAFRWSPEGHQLAFTTSASANHPTPYSLMLVDDPGADAPRALYETRRGDGHPFEWLASGDLLIADNSVSDARLERVTTEGDAKAIATVQSTVWYLYPSPDRKFVAFTQNSFKGWQLWTVDGPTGEIRNAGNMGSDPAGIAPPDENPPIRDKGPMYIAWSPDSTRVAFGGGYEPPYMMTIADLTSGEKHRTAFPDGYPGEIKWSPDGSTLAVSSYNLPRTHHESYIVDPNTGVAKDILSGCVIVWSPDSRFLAIHGEREPGVAIADVVTLKHVQLTHTAGDTPLSWIR
jgi:dipeptidyl aminopeptidase/acylaminoacyl peptidase